MAGVVGAGGLGDFAIRYGHQRSEPDVIWVTILIILILVTIAQAIGDVIIDVYKRQSLHVPCFGTAHTEAENTQAMINAVQNPYVKILGHPDDSRYPIDQEAVVLACKATHTLVEVNNSSMNPKSSRVGGRENMLGMLRYCKQHGVPVLFGSDAHYCDAIGRFQRCEEVCAAAEFPASLIVNSNPELIFEYFHLKVE